MILQEKHDTMGGGQDYMAGAVVVHSLQLPEVLRKWSVGELAHTLADLLMIYSPCNQYICENIHVDKMQIDERT